MAESSKTEGYENTEINTQRVSISCPSSSKETYNFRLSQVTKETLSTAFDIPASMKFFLVDANNNIEFATRDGIFDVTPSTKYRVQISKQTVIKNSVDEKKSDIRSFRSEISVSGNEDGRKTAKGFFLTVHGSNQKDLRDGSTFYVIGHNNNTTKGIWKFYPFQPNNGKSLYTIQLLKVSDGRACGKGQWLTVHGSNNRDKRDKV
eukprot:UN07596